jgi:putative methionine-R-sulfoxide reductase with GAF domain
MADEIASDKKGKPAFDEQTLAKLLEAAYVMQEHNRELQKMELRVDPPARPAERGEPVAPGPTPSAQPETAPKDDYTAILAQIVETQHQIQVRHLPLEPAISLIVERVVEITKAAGAAIAILDGRDLRYRAAAGSMTLPVGTGVPLEKALCSASLRVGDVIRCADVNPEFLIDATECHRRGIESLICVPVYHDGKTAGGLEVYYAKAHAFSEPDVHSCQLMAGLVTEALARNEELTSKNSLATERAVMLEALEKLKPNLAALVDSTAAKMSTPPASPTTLPAPPPAFRCRKCSHEMAHDEQFCGECGLPRSGEYEPPSMQSKVASMLSMQEAARKNTSGSFTDGLPANLEPLDNSNGTHTGRSLADSVEAEMPELFRLPEPAGAAAAVGAGATTRPSLSMPVPGEEASEEDRDAETDVMQDAAQEDAPSPGTALAKPNESTPWHSAAAAREFLERLAGNKHSGSGALVRFLSARRGDVYLALAVLLVACAIRWGIWSSHSVSATGSPTAAAAAHRKPDADLPLFDRLLVKLGLAEAPEAPEEKGNPDIQVWIDLHTALYYCPGSDLYGKTPKGKFATQRDAQLDQFEPAYRKACN